MSDQLVAEALRSKASLVVVEAPAGFGKTFQGAQYAKDLLPGLSSRRLLILAHTNAACDVFADRTRGFGGRIEIRTIDSLITRIATAYHKALGLPLDVPNWALQQGQGAFNELPNAWLVSCYEHQQSPPLFRHGTHMSCVMNIRIPVRLNIKSSFSSTAPGRSYASLQIQCRPSIAGRKTSNLGMGRDRGDVGSKTTCQFPAISWVEQF